LAVLWITLQCTHLVVLIGHSRKFWLDGHTVHLMIVEDVSDLLSRVYVVLQRLEADVDCGNNANADQSPDMELMNCDNSRSGQQLFLNSLQVNIAWCGLQKN